VDSSHVGSRRNDRLDPGGSVKLDDAHADWPVSLIALRCVGIC
jgi:hypothetical protein